VIEEEAALEVGVAEDRTALEAGSSPLDPAETQSEQGGEDKK
jgi:hypothetical protein